MRRYVSDDEDSARWHHVRLREGDIIISTRSKSGTTWMQMICALLVFGDPDLPAPLSQLSPWVDHTIEPVGVLANRLEGQLHRRILKTHTPLDGIPLDARVHYIVVARHPLDMAVSLYHQGDNIDRVRLAELTGVPAAGVGERVDLHDWLLAWTRDETSAQTQMDSLIGVLHHVRGAWERQRDSSVDVMLVHYADLTADLEGTMRSLAARLRLAATEGVFPELVSAASFDSMRQRADWLAPNPLGVLQSNQRFFRAGRSGEGAAVLSPAELVAYEQRVQELIPRDLFTWLHR